MAESVGAGVPDLPAAEGLDQHVAYLRQVVGGSGGPHPIPSMRRLLAEYDRRGKKNAELRALLCEVLATWNDEDAALDALSHGRPDGDWQEIGTRLGLKAKAVRTRVRDALGGEHHAGE